MELVAGNTVYNNDGSIYCELTNGGTLEADGYQLSQISSGRMATPNRGLEIKVSIAGRTPNRLGNCELCSQPQ